jgi:hypothetical protein
MAVLTGRLRFGEQRSRDTANPTQIWHEHSANLGCLTHWQSDTFDLNV